MTIEMIEYYFGSICQIWTPIMTQIGPYVLLCFTRRHSMDIGQCCFFIILPYKLMYFCRKFSDVKELIIMGDTINKKIAKM